MSRTAAEFDAASKVFVADDITSRLTDWAASQSDIDALYLFGSQVEGRTHAASDVDVAVLARRDSVAQELWRLEDRWAASWPDWVDLHVLNLAPIAVQFEVITSGRRLWQRSQNRVAEYESWVRRRYWDLEPLHEREWHSFVETLWEQRNDAEREEYQDSLAQVRSVHRRIREASASNTG
ncbi:MAG: nucleotidyltransferase domain-containing protein [Anaerolineae bacterium]|nr:nucleotidyltransferase domain-containing protein [Anaerolineae bacterium]MCB0239260.1 nucleotidyltransferase domain-containing protein [Anaerolineae bacterium]MCB0242386.1 nucleotidyltransferase domain-containing protein [Anaerolineae bacterium]MCB0250410.1 nucleotidyltransferase domain-containing protein [Anaerolineae bacterium]MCB9140940.1 nucleotidyltransferase domain-containing protein [Anaerolineales bacterium]